VPYHPLSAETALPVDGDRIAPEPRPDARTPRRFMSPFDVPTPPGAEGWEQMYPYYTLFSPERRASEEDRCWFFDSMHFPEPIPPFDSVSADSTFLAFGQSNTRLFCVPPALGVDHRIVNGYVFISVNGVSDPEEIERRVGLFIPRASHYYRHWDDLYSRWEAKMMAAIREVDGIRVPHLPDAEDESVITSGSGVGSANEVLVAYNRCLESIHRVWQYHFELLNLGYAAHLTFFTFCRQAFPDISDQAVTKMVSGVDFLLLRPDAELKRLARVALDLRLADAFEDGRPPEVIEARLAASEAGRQWLAELARTKDPWFNLSYGSGFYHHHRSWIDDPAHPFAAIGGYIRRLGRGEDITRPMEGLARERDRVIAEYRALLRTSDSRRVFDDTLGLAQKVFPYVENHNFYVEHWYHTVFWNKVREFGALLARGGFFARPDDIFFLHRHEVSNALCDLLLAWASGSEARGPRYWPPIVEKRRAILEALRSWSPPPALGPAPDTMTDPLMIMLWGMTPAQVQKWLAPTEEDEGGGGHELRGLAGSPGVAEGRARLALRSADLDALEDGEILVCPVMLPSLTIVFGKLNGAVSDSGGVMSHAAIVAREYGLPAVVGAGIATHTIKTGQRIRVDGNIGVVTILDERGDG
jgi:pyruvate, water dikinase